MTDYTISTTTTQETGLTKTVAKVNADRAAETPPKSAITNTQYVNKISKGAFDSYVNQTDEEDRASVKDAFKDADAATKAQIKTLLGL